jgi:hypothetical protein
MINARDTLELLADLAKVSRNDQFIEASSFRILATTLINDQVAKGITPDERTDGKEVKSTSDYLAFGVAAITNSNPKVFYCDPEMSAVIQASAGAMDNTDLTDLTLLPSKYGFCYFAQGVRLSEGMIIHGLLWCEQPKDPNNILLYGLNDKLNEEDRSRGSWAEYLENHGYDQIKHERWVFRFHLSYTAGTQLSPLSPEEREEFTAKSRELYKMHTIDLDPRQVFHALMLMLNQEPEVIQISKAEATKKKAARLVKKSMPTEVTVIDIRRKYATTGSASSGTSDREYSHRWVVSGFWRWQPYKDANKEWKRKRIWIDSYVKGPADKPLHVTDKVYALLK